MCAALLHANRCSLLRAGLLASNPAQVERIGYALLTYHPTCSLAKHLLKEKFLYADPSGNEISQVSAASPSALFLTHTFARTRCPRFDALIACLATAARGSLLLSENAARFTLAALVHR